MAAVAQETVNIAPDYEANANESDPLSDHDEDHQTDEDDDDEEEHEEENENETKEWDEGGKSHCGYGDTVHDTLMSIGESIHKVVGEPNEGVQHAMKSVGNWFQEASYAARDLKSGKMDVAGETASVLKSVVSGDEDDNKEDCEGGGEGDEGQMVGDDKLTTVKEDISVRESDVSS